MANTERQHNEVSNALDTVTSANAVQVSMDKVDAMEVRIASLDDLAGEVGDRTGPDALWGELSEKAKLLQALEARIKALEEHMSLRPRAGLVGFRGR